MRQSPSFYSLLFQIVTTAKRYNIPMNILTVFPVKGLFLTLLLFAVCLIGVHTILLAQVGWKFQHTRKDPPPKNDEKKAPIEKEPIYYIVERKTKRAKTGYGEPKQIHFKP